MDSTLTMPRSLKRYLAWSLNLIAIVGVFVSYYGIYLLMAYFAAGLVWWANLALFTSGPIGAAAAAVAWVKPRQRIAMAIGLFGLAFWVTLWVLMFTAFGFRLM